MAVQGLSWLSGDKQRESMLERWTIAFIKCTMAHVREECDLQSLLEVRFNSPSACFNNLSRAGAL